MNKAVQVSSVEHELKKVEGNTIVTSKKRRKIYAKESADAPSTALSSYMKPDTYNELVNNLTEACRQGEAEAKEVVEKLAPHMAKTLKDKNKWGIPIEHKSDVTLIKANKSEIISNSPLLHDKLIDSLLGPLTQCSAMNVSELEVPELASAYANLLTDLRST